LQLKSQFVIVQKLWRLSVFNWEEDAKMVTASNDVWTAYIQLEEVFEPCMFRLLTSNARLILRQRSGVPSWCLTPVVFSSFGLGCFCRPMSDVVFTFNLLNSFYLFTLEGKTSAHDFYFSIARKSDNTGTLDVKVYLIFVLVLVIFDVLDSIDMSSSWPRSVSGVISNSPHVREGFMIPVLLLRQSQEIALSNVRPDRHFEHAVLVIDYSSSCGRPTTCYWLEGVCNYPSHPKLNVANQKTSIHRSLPHFVIVMS
jgi:hypothetical protein